MKTSLFKRVVICAFTFQLFSSFNLHCMLNNIAGTWAILENDYKHLALDDAATAWEIGAIRRLYDLGQIFPFYGKDSKDRPVITSYKDFEMMHKTIRLLHALFYRVPGSEGETDFNITTHLKNNDPLVVAGLMANIIAQWLSLQQNQQKFNDSLNSIQNVFHELGQEALQEKVGKKLTLNDLSKKIKDLQENPWNENYKTDLIYRCRQIFSENAFEIHEKTITTFNRVFFGIIESLKLLLMQGVFKKGEQVGPIIYGALNECNPNSPTALYPPNTIQIILLAFVYKKCSYSRDALKVFYETLNNALDGNVLKDGQPTIDWGENSFKPINQAIALNSLKDIFAQGELAIRSHMDTILYCTQHIRTLPKLIGYSQATYEFELGKQTKWFPNCMDNTIRNLINVLCYDAENNCFDLTLLKQRLNIEQFDPLLEEFYVKYKNVNDAQSDKAHNAWINVISNIPYAAYTKATGLVDNKDEPIPARSLGYISVPKNFTIPPLSKIKTYDAILSENQHGYELMPSLANLIIVLNHLLHLDILDNRIDLIVSSTLKDEPTDLARFFQSLCKKLNVYSGYLSRYRDDRETEKVNFAALDKTQEPIFSTFVFNLNPPQFTCKIMTSNGKHGEMYLTGDLGNEEKELIELFEKNSSIISNLSGKLLTTNILCRQSIDFSFLNNYQQPNDYLRLFAIPLEQSGALKQIIETLTPVVNKGIPTTARTQIRNLLLRLAYKTLSSAELQDAIVAILRILTDPTEVEDINAIVQDALRYIKLDDSSIQDAGFAIIEALVNLKYETIFDHAAEIAIDSFNDEDLDVSCAGLAIFKALVNQSYQNIFEQATDVAFKAYYTDIETDDDSDNDDDSDDDTTKLQSAGLAVIKALVKKKYRDIFPQAAKIAQEVYESDYTNLACSGLAIYKALVEQGYQEIFEQATEAALNACQSDNIDIQLSGISLLISFVKHNPTNDIFTNATEIATTAIFGKQTILKRPGFALFQALFDQGQGFGNAIQIILTRCKQGTISKVCSSFLKQMLSKNNIQKTLAAISQAALSQNENVKKTGLEMFFLLVDNNFENTFESALNAALTSIENSMNNVGIEILKGLFKKEYGFDRAIELAKKLSYSEYYPFRGTAIRLFEELFRYKKGLAQALLLAQDPSIENDVTARILVMLVTLEYEQAYDVALDFALHKNIDQSMQLFQILLGKNPEKYFDKVLAGLLDQERIVSAKPLLIQILLDKLKKINLDKTQQAIHNFLQSEAVEQSTKTTLENILMSGQ